MEFLPNVYIIVVLTIIAIIIMKTIFYRSFAIAANIPIAKFIFIR